MLETLMRLEMVYDAEVNRLIKTDTRKALSLIRKQTRIIKQIRELMNNHSVVDNDAHFHIWTKDENCRFSDLNDALAERIKDFTGLSKSEIIGKTITDILPDFHAEEGIERGIIASGLCSITIHPDMCDGLTNWVVWRTKYRSGTFGISIQVHNENELQFVCNTIKKKFEKI